MKGANKFCMTSLCLFWRQIEDSLFILKFGSCETLQMTFRHSHHKNGTLKLDRLNACFQFSEPRIGSLKSDCVNRPLHHKILNEIFSFTPLGVILHMVTILIVLRCCHGNLFFESVVEWKSEESCIFYRILA